MRRPRRRSKVSVSLFPFLSVLACIIGTLTLMLAGLTVGHMGTPGEGPQETLLAEAAEIAKRLATARDEAKLLQSHPITPREEEQAVLSLLAGRKARREVKASLESQLRQILAEIRSLEGQIRNVTDPPRNPFVLVRPGGSGVGLKPQFVECTAHELILNHGATHVPKGALEHSDEFRTLLRRVGSEPEATLVFLIRPDAVKTFDAARALALKGRTRHGFLPVPGHGKIDLSLFDTSGRR